MYISKHLSIKNTLKIRIKLGGVRLISRNGHEKGNYFKNVFMIIISV